MSSKQLRAAARAVEQQGIEPNSPAGFAMLASDARYTVPRHIRKLNEYLMAVARGELRRLIVQMPPRHGKSNLCSEYFPCWYMGNFPQRNIIVCSATDQLSADFSQSSRDLMREFGPSTWNVKVRRDAKARRRWMLEQGGAVRAAGVGGSIMGRGCDLLLIDDYAKSWEDIASEVNRESIARWYASTSSTRLTPDGAIIIIATRWHDDDLIGRLLKEQHKGGEQWAAIRWPALAEIDDPLGREPGEPLWPERFNKQWLETRKAAYCAAGYEWMWSGLYQQEPPTQIDSEWPREYFDDQKIWFDEWPDASRIALRVITLDPSMGASEKADYSAFIMMALDNTGILFVDADLRRRDSVGIATDAVRLGRQFNPDGFGIEGNGFQKLLAGPIEEESRKLGMMLPLWLMTNTDKKIERIRRITPYLARNEIRFKRNSPGASLLVEQLRAFPGGKYDDGPDALEMAFRLMRQLFDDHFDFYGPSETEHRAIYT